MEYIQKPVNTQMPASSRDISTCVSCAAHICWSYSGGRTVWPEDLHYQILWLELLLMAG